MRGSVDGEQYAQVSNPDPFASPVWRSPVYRTPEGIIYLVQAARLIWRLVWFLIRHPLLDMAGGTAFLLWRATGWPGLAWSASGLAAGLVLLRVGWPSGFTWLVAQPVRNRWRWWCYRRRWQSVLGIAGLAPSWQDRRLVPVLGQVQAGGMRIWWPSGWCPGRRRRRSQTGLRS
jgi:S-DNA-T family DNA segregation ATPase FtsK/SpoIIIE